MVDRLLFGRQIAPGDLLNLRRQFTGNFTLHPPQDKGPEPLAQPLQGSRILLLGNGNFIALTKFRSRPEITRHQEIKNRPQITQRIFQWRTGQHEPVLGTERFDRLGILAEPVLDVLGFIQDHGLPVNFLMLRHIAPQYRIGGNDEVMRGNCRKQFLPVRAMEHQRLQLRREPLHLSLPVCQQAGGADN